jgi:CheY-like chemotaxis protein
MSKKSAIRIVSIDDKMITTDLDRAGYRKMGAEIRVVQSYDQAEKMIVAGEAELVVINMDYKKVDAKIICKHLKATHPKVPVVMTSVGAQATNNKKALDAGADLFIVQPIPRQTFIEKLKQLLDHQTRTTQRVEVASAARYLINGKEHSCPIGDLSVSGVLLQMSSELPAGTKLTVEFDIPGSKKPISASGEVVRILRQVAGLSYNDGSVGVGVRFDDFKGDSQKRLEKYIDQNSSSHSEMLYYL